MNTLENKTPTVVTHLDWYDNGKLTATRALPYPMTPEQVIQFLWPPRQHGPRDAPGWPFVHV